MGGLQGETVPSKGFFMTQDLGPLMGINDWVRPPCFDGTCNSQACNGAYLCLPFTPLTPSQVAWDSSTLYIWGGNLDLWGLSEGTWGLGWSMLAPGSAAAGSFGRRVFVSGDATAFPGSGCFFSTDFPVLDIWTSRNKTASSLVTSSSAFSVAASAAGPWRGPFTAPWSPRVSAALALTADGRSFWVGGGLDFQGGVPTGQGAIDVWAVDASVCLIAGASGQPCNGQGTPNLDSVTCACPYAWSGDELCASCGANVEGSKCDACAEGFWGPSCTACPPCGSHGSCSGAGTQGGSGTCICQQGWSGTSCNVPATSASASRSASSSPAPGAGGGGGGANTTKAQPLSGGAAFGVSLLVILSAAAAAAFVFAKFYGGGPTLAKWGGQAWEFTVWAFQGAANGAVTLYRSLTAPAAGMVGGGAPSQATAPPYSSVGAAGGERASLLRSKPLVTPPVQETGGTGASPFAGPAFGSL
jgi:hypothetical protein